MMEVSVNHLLLQMLSKSFILSCIRFWKRKSNGRDVREGWDGGQRLCCTGQTQNWGVSATSSLPLPQEEHRGTGHLLLFLPGVTHTQGTSHENNSRHLPATRKVENPIDGLCLSLCGARFHWLIQGVLVLAALRQFNRRSTPGTFQPGAGWS